MESPVNTPTVNKGGAKYKYTVDQVAELVDKFVAERLKDNLPPSQARFALYAHVDEDTITNWKDKEGYSEQIKKLTLASKAFTQDMLFTMKNPAGAIFYGKNYHDMADVQKLDVSGTIDHRLLPPDDGQIARLLAKAQQHEQAVIEAEYQVLDATSTVTSAESTDS